LKDKTTWHDIDSDSDIDNICAMPHAQPMHRYYARNLRDNAILTLAFTEAFGEESPSPFLSDFFFLNILLSLFIIAVFLSYVVAFPLLLFGVSRPAKRPSVVAMNERAQRSSIS